jgi:hypothetical protein
MLCFPFVPSLNSTSIAPAAPILFAQPPLLAFPLALLQAAAPNAQELVKNLELAQKTASRRLQRRRYDDESRTILSSRASQ